MLMCSICGMLPHNGQYGTPTGWVPSGSWLEILGGAITGTLGDVGFEQIVDPVDRHSLARSTLLGGQIASLKPGGEDLLCGDPRLMEGDTTVSPNRVFSQPRTCTARPIQNDENL